jgi:hypothetical protein
MRAACRSIKRKPLLDMSDSQLSALVPKLNGLIFCGCPNCDAGSHDQQLEWVGWNDPDKVRCKYCGMVFPNEQYPEIETRSARNPRGEQVTYHFYRDQSHVYFFSAKAFYERNKALAAKALRLAELAYLSKDPLHERKAVVLLDAFGERYPDWCVMSDHRTVDQGPLDSYPKKPHPYYGGIWSRWYYNDIPLDLLFAYNLVYDSPQWEKRSAEIGIDVRKRIEDQVFRKACSQLGLTTRCYRARRGSNRTRWRNPNSVAHYRIGPAGNKRRARPMSFHPPSQGGRLQAR